MIGDREAGSRACLTEKAFAKLNLTLDVLGKRLDGYHELRMVMCSLKRCFDTLTLTPGTGSWQLTCTKDALLQDAEIPLDGRNLCLRAARAYFDAAGIDPGGLHVHIDKHIPAQAGMAGGSSDAAAVLRALNRHYGVFSDAQLRALGLQIGSDVPYCLFGGVALAEGRGERLTRLPELPEGLYFVLAVPAFSASTPALFRAIDDRRAAGGTAATPAMLSALQGGDRAAIGRALANDFAPVLAGEHPVVETVKQALVEHGALGSELTGTGSVIYGLFDDSDRANAAARALTRELRLITAIYPY